jgi:hypothetical protein
MKHTFDKNRVFFTEKEIFLDIVLTLDECWTRTHHMEEVLKMGISEYEEPFYSIIDKLMLLVWGANVYELVTFYLYERIGLDGTPNYLVETDDEGKEKEIYLNTAEELYNYLMQIDSNFLSEK